MQSGVLKLKGKPDLIPFSGWCDSSFDVVFLPGLTTEISFRVSSSADQARDFWNCVCNGARHGYSFSIVVYGDRIVQTVLVAERDGNTWELGIVPSEIARTIRQDWFWENMGTSASVDAFSSVRSDVGSEMSIDKWNLLMGAADLIDCCEMSDSEFRDMMDSVDSAIVSFSYVTKVRIIIESCR